MEVEVMEQLGLPMLTVYEGPRLVDAEVVAACKTYREAVRACWDMRTRRNLTKRKLAEDAGLYASHVTDYLSDKPSKRDLPADRINDFELQCGNRLVSQWMARRSQLPVMDGAFLAHIERMRSVA
jgi:hypothetical protein